jgi:hypothetical protein
MQLLSKTLINQLNQIIEETTRSKTRKTLKNNRIINSNPKRKGGYRGHCHHLPEDY